MASSPFVWGSGGRRMTPEEIAMQRQLAEQQRMAAADYSPVGHWTQGLARMSQGLFGGLRERRADRAAQRNTAEQQDALARIIESMTGGGVDSDVAALTSPNQDIVQALSASPDAAVEPAQFLERRQPEPIVSIDPNIGHAAIDPVEAVDNPVRFRDAIASVESMGSGDYGAIGPRHDQLGRPLGRYQVMEANLPQWSREALGRQVSVDEFMANPELQDAIFDHRFGLYRDQFGDELAADAWFAGPGGVDTNRQDSLGTSVPEYRRRYMDALGASPQSEIAAALGGEGAPLDAIGGSPSPSATVPQQDLAQSVAPSYMPPPAPSAPQINPEIIQLLSSPYVDDNVRNIAAALFEQQMTPASDNSLMKVGDVLFDTRTGGWITPPGYGDQQLPDSVRALTYRAQEAGLVPGSPEYQAFMAQGGASADESAASQRIARLSENLMSTGDFVDPEQARNIAVGIVDGRLRADRHPVTGELQVVDMATGRPVYGGRGAGGAPSSGEAAAAPAQDNRFGDPYQQAEESFGVTGGTARVANRIADALGLDPINPEIMQTQSDFNVLKESLLNDIASSYGRQPPSWLLQEIRNLTPTAGSFLEGAREAQTKMRSIGRQLEGELRVQRDALTRNLSPERQQEAEARIVGLETAISRIQTALGSFDGGQPTSGRDASAGPAPAGVSQDNWEFMTPEDRSLFP